LYYTLIELRAFAIVPPSWLALFAIHIVRPSRRLELEAALAGAIGNCLDSTVIEETAAIEDDRRNSGVLRALGNDLADRD
jgi:hypothetical protein